MHRDWLVNINVCTALAANSELKVAKEYAAAAYWVTGQGSLRLLNCWRNTKWETVTTAQGRLFGNPRFEESSDSWKQTSRLWGTSAKKQLVEHGQKKLLAVRISSSSGRWLGVPASLGGNSWRLVFDAVMGGKHSREPTHESSLLQNRRRQLSGHSTFGQMDGEGETQIRFSRCISRKGKMTGWFRWEGRGEFLEGAAGGSV